MLVRPFFLQLWPLERRLKSCCLNIHQIADVYSANGLKTSSQVLTGRRASSSYVVQSLRSDDTETVEDRKQKVRNTVEAVVECDMTKDPPIRQGYDVEYDVVISSLVLHLAPKTNEEFFAIVNRVGKLVKKGGSLLLFLTENDTSFEVGSYTFKVFPLDPHVVERALQFAGFTGIKFGEKLCTEEYTYFFMQGIRK